MELKVGDIAAPSSSTEKKIPERMFLSTMDGHSHGMQELALSLFEPRLGRTKLRSIRSGGDNEGSGFMYIDIMHVDSQYKQNGNSDVGAYALHQLLGHPCAKGKGVASCFYTLDPCEAMSKGALERYAVCS